MPRLTRAEQRAVTRQRLVEAAGRVFCRVGFEAAPIDVIADEAGYHGAPSIPTSSPRTSCSSSSWATISAPRSTR